MNKEQLKTHLLVTGKVTYYREGEYWAASYSKFFGFGKDGDQALDCLAQEICDFKDGLDGLEVSLEIDQYITQRLVADATMQ